MNIQMNEFETEKRLIYGVLTENKNKKIGLERIEDIFSYRLAGMLLYLSYLTVIDLDTDLKEFLIKIEKLNTIRNSTIEQEIKKIDEFLVNYNVSHLWIKGIRDILSDKKQLGIRKMIDSDLLVSKNVDIKALMEEYGIKQGNVTMDGHLLYPSSRDEILTAERGHYEYVPFVKILSVDKVLPEDIPLRVINRYRIFKQANNYYTDFILDIHHALTVGLSFEEGLHNKSYPLMSDIDDLWYCMNKSYYEVIKGKKKDLQIILSTIRKYKQCGIEIQDIAERLKSISTEIYNENVFLFYSKLISADNKALDYLIFKIRGL